MVPRMLVCSVLWLTAGAVPAQFFSSVATETRRTARATWLGRSGEQNVVFEYGQPTWRADYERFMEGKEATPLLLGNGALATLRTDVELAFGAQKVARGRWYVGMRRDDQGAWSLTLFAGDKVEAGGRGATTILSTEPDVRIPVKVTRERESVALFDMTLADVKPTPNLTLTMAWGPYRVTTGIAAAFDTRSPEGAPKFTAAAADKSKKTASGLVYEALHEGEGASPQATDRVRVHYAGWLADGTMFDSSWLRGEPETFPLEMVQAGFAEGVRLMKPGATYRLTMPPELAYGERGAGRIPPNATLVFTVTLFGVER